MNAGKIFDFGLVKSISATLTYGMSTGDAYRNSPLTCIICKVFTRLAASMKISVSIAIRQSEKLDDIHVSAASKLLRKQFPNIQGLSTPRPNFSFPVIDSTLLAGCGNQYIQTLCTVADHWVVYTFIPFIWSEKYTRPNSVFLLIKIK